MYWLLTKLLLDDYGINPDQHFDANCNKTKLAKRKQHPVMAPPPRPVQWWLRPCRPVPGELWTWPSSPDQWWLRPSCPDQQWLQLALSHLRLALWKRLVPWTTIRTRLIQKRANSWKYLVEENVLTMYSRWEIGRPRIREVKWIPIVKHSSFSNYIKLQIMNMIMIVMNLNICSGS